MRQSNYLREARWRGGAHRGSLRVISAFLPTREALNMQSAFQPLSAPPAPLPPQPYPSAMGRSLSRPGGGEYFHIAVALYSSLAASDHNKLRSALWDCDTMHWRNSGGVTKSIIWNFCFFFVLDSMLLFSCHLVPFFPIFCFEGFVSDSSFLLWVLSFLLPCFCLCGLPPPLDTVCSEPHFPFLSCSRLPYFSFSFCLIVSYNTEKTNSLFVCMLLHGVM